MASMTNIQVFQAEIEDKSCCAEGPIAQSEDQLMNFSQTANIAQIGSGLQGLILTLYRELRKKERYGIHRTSLKNVVKMVTSYDVYLRKQKAT